MRKTRQRSSHRGVGIALAAMLLTAALPALASSEIAGQVGDKKITLDEVDAKAKRADAAVYQSLYEVRRKALDAMIENQLLETEAAARKISVEELVKQEIDQKVVPVSEEDIQAWYDDNKIRVAGRPLDSIRVQIRQFLAMQRETEARSAFFDQLKKKTAVKIALEPPRVNVAIAANDPYKGPKDAPVTIVEYADYQ